jgi:enoyl-CoA hydratase
MRTVLAETPMSGVLLITLNRPEKCNALNLQLLDELARILVAAEENEAVRCVVITGDERSFSAGADIVAQHEEGANFVFSEARLSNWQRIQNFAKPTIAAVNGYALGGGCELMMLMDFAVAGENAIFGQPEINLGILPGDGATQRLPRLVGRGHAMRLILSGERIGAAQALRIGLVTEVVPTASTVTRALELASTIAAKSPLAARLCKDAIRRGADLPLAAGLLVERDNLMQAFGSTGQREAMSAFVARQTGG